MNTCEKILEHFSNIQDILENYNFFTLEDLAPDNQMTRYDLKYVFPSPLIPEILERASRDYLSLRLSETCQHPYRSSYFDTDDLEMYNHHHNEKARRFKIRIREYISTGDYYLEIKQKSNKGFTIKKRISINKPDIKTPEAYQMINKLTPYIPSSLKKTVVTQFYRCTFIHRNTSERVTMDYCIELFVNNQTKFLPGTCIVEIKKKDSHTVTSFEEILGDLGIVTCNFSKYCMGLAFLDDQVKYNRFKENILFINQLENEFHKQYTDNLPVE